MYDVIYKIIYNPKDNSLEFSYETEGFKAVFTLLSEVGEPYLPWFKEQLRIMGIKLDVVTVMDRRALISKIVSTDVTFCPTKKESLIAYGWEVRNEISEESGTIRWISRE